MNRIYRSIWNEKTRTYVAVAETAKSAGNKTSSVSTASSGDVRFALKALAASMMLAFGTAAIAAPTGGQISAGAGSINQTGTATTINQSSQNLAINWQSFGVAANESVRFNQPNTGAIALNRVTGQSPSAILGSMSANGQVFVLNPNGVLFGAGSQVNVGGLVATTLSLSDADLMAGKHSFSGSGGSVVNQGKLTAAQGGYIALLAPEVRNEGVISATLGTAVLAAGNQVTLHINNGGLVSFTLDKGALNALAENKQLIQADGGQIYMSAKAADALAKAVVNNTGIIQAQTLQNKGGVIKLIGDMQVGTVNVGGTLDASAPSPSASLLPLPQAGEGQGRGGFIETSAAHVKIDNNVKVTTLAANGLSGSWLIDPVDFTIAATGGDMTGATLTANLALGAVNILSTNGATGTAGNINVNDSVSWAANLLTLTAQNNININAAMNASGTASLALVYGQGALAAGNTSKIVTGGAGVVNLPAGTTNFTTKQGSNGLVTAYTVITALGAAGSVTATDLQGMSGNLAANYVLGANIDATSTSTWNANAGFAPIGSSFAIKFTGAFDGLGHTITGLTINRPTTDFVGLFGFTNSTTSEIRNVGLVGGSVTGRNNVGVLAGYGKSKISNSYATGSVTGGNIVGGLVGYGMSTISNSYATGSVTGTSNVGGLVGIIGGGTISNSYATGSVTGTSNVGGLVANSSYSNTISNSYATGLVTGTSNVGGLMGRKATVTITNSFWNTTTSGKADGLGIGMNGAVAGVAGTPQVGVTGLSTAQMQTQASFTGFDFANTWTIFAGQSNPLLRSFMTDLVVTANGGSKIYDGVAGNGVSYSVTPNMSNLLGTLSYGVSANVGSYTTALSGLTSAPVQKGYLSITYVNSALTVTPKALTITGMTASNKVYDGSTSATLSGGSLSGLVGTETLTFSGQTGAFADANVGTAKAVTVSGTKLVDGTGLASNYTVTNPTGITADITAATPVVTTPVVTGNISPVVSAALSKLIPAGSSQQGQLANLINSFNTAKVAAQPPISVASNSAVASPVFAAANTSTEAIPENKAPTQSSSFNAPSIARAEPVTIQQVGMLTVRNGGISLARDEMRSPGESRSSLEN